MYHVIQCRLMSLTKKQISLLGLQL
uniref:Uncharacterized protein n=1 Tax=Anguilla anguilla TaxID=7936 RepID=A0A0E9SBH7_ANGAN